MARNLYQEHNEMTDILNDFLEMFEALDKFRKTKDKRDLFTTRDIENRARKKMNELISSQTVATETQPKAA
jgi:hypothetical protein